MDRTGHGIVSPSAREGRLDYDLDRYALGSSSGWRSCHSARNLWGMHADPSGVFDRIGTFDEGFSYGGCEDIDSVVCEERRIHLDMKTLTLSQSPFCHGHKDTPGDVIKSTETKAYPLQDLSHFQAKWKRTVRGNWANRRWDDLSASLRKRRAYAIWPHAGGKRKTVRREQREWGRFVFDEPTKPEFKPGVRMRIGIDAAPLIGNRGGVGWHTYYLLRALLNLKEDLEFVVYVRAGLREAWISLNGHMIFPYAGLRPFGGEWPQWVHGTGSISIMGRTSSCRRPAGLVESSQFTTCGWTCSLAILVSCSVSAGRSTGPRERC